MGGGDKEGEREFQTGFMLSMQSLSQCSISKTMRSEIDMKIRSIEK